MKLAAVGRCGQNTGGHSAISAGGLNAVTSIQIIGMTISSAPAISTACAAQ